MKAYYDVIIEGSEDIVRGFVDGLIASQNLEEKSIIVAEEHVEKRGAIRQVLRVLQLKEDRVHLLAEKNLLDALTKAVSSGRKPPFKVLSAKTVRAASFGFSLKAFSKPVAERIKERVSNLPEGVEVKFSKWHEETRPGEEGIEAYAPAHDYELHAAGQVQGPPDAVVELYEKMQTNEMFELGLIQMEYGDPIPL